MRRRLKQAEPVVRPRMTGSVAAEIAATAGADGPEPRRGPLPGPYSLEQRKTAAILRSLLAAHAGRLAQIANHRHAGDRPDEVPAVRVEMIDPDPHLSRLDRRLRAATPASSRIAQIVWPGIPGTVFVRISPPVTRETTKVRQSPTGHDGARAAISEAANQRCCSRSSRRRPSRSG